MRKHSTIISFKVFFIMAKGPPLNATARFFVFQKLLLPDMYLFTYFQSEFFGKSHKRHVNSPYIPRLLTKRRL